MCFLVCCAERKVLLQLQYESAAADECQSGPCPVIDKTDVTPTAQSCLNIHLPGGDVSTGIHQPSAHTQMLVEKGRCKHQNLDKPVVPIPL